MSKLVDPDAPVTVEVRNGRRYIPLPSREEVAQKVHKLTKKLSDLPAPPDKSNPIAVALCYELFGLDPDETAIAMGINVQLLNGIKSTEHYSQFKQEVLNNIRTKTIDAVTRKFEDAQGNAADKVVELLDSPSGMVRLSAAKMVLDKAGTARAEDPMKSGLQIVIYNNVGTDAPTVIEHQS